MDETAGMPDGTREEDPGADAFGIPPVVPRPAADLEPVLAWLRSGEAVAGRTDFPAGTALPDGRLDMCKQNLGPAGAAAVARALPEGGGPVRHLLLGTDGLGDEGVDAVVPAAVGAHVQTLYLGCNGIGEGGACTIAGQLLASPGVVQALWLKRNPLGEGGTRAIAEVVREGTVLRTLDLVQTGLDAAGLAELVDALLTGRRVTRVYLGGNRLGPEGAAHLARLVSAGVLAELYVPAAFLGDAGAAALTEGLRSAPSGALRRLSVASNGIGPRALADLVATAARAGVELVDAARVRAAGTLGADDNRLDEPAAAVIGAALGGGPHRLAYLDLRHTGVGSRGALRLLDGARQAGTPTRYMLGAGIASRVKKELAVLAAGTAVPETPRDARSVRSVHRTA